MLKLARPSPVNWLGVLIIYSESKHTHQREQMVAQLNHTSDAHLLTRPPTVGGHPAAGHVAQAANQHLARIFFKVAPSPLHTTSILVKAAGMQGALTQNCSQQLNMLLMKACFFLHERHNAGL